MNIYQPKTIIPNVKTICMPKLIIQKDAQPQARYNVQLWHSYDGGKTFYYVGIGRFFSDYYEAEVYMKAHLKNLDHDLITPTV